jgi:chromatin remodeling complex protein RSC6
MKKRRNPRSKFWKPLTPSAKLAAVIGEGQVTRTEMISKLWKYIRRNKLQSKSNPRMIKTDEALGAVCKTSGQVNMFDMTKMAHRQLA